MKRLAVLGLLALSACSHGGPGSVIVLALDGMDPQTVDLLLSEGRMPHFARLRRDGAYGRLSSSKPLLSPVVWTTVATGKTPDHHGIGHFVALDPATGEPLPVTSRMRRVKAVWNVLSEAKKKVGVVGWWATWPAETVEGVVVSDHTTYHFLFPQAAGGARDDAGLTHPPELLARIAPLIRRPENLTAEETSAFLRVAPEELTRPFSFDDDVSHFKWALAAAETNRRVGLELWRRERPDLLMVYVEATDSVSHLFGHLFRAGALSGELAEQKRRYGGAVEGLYLYADRLVGEFLEAAGGEATLVVLSDHGFDLGAAQEDPSKTRDLRRVSERFHRPEGILYLHGPGIRRVRLDKPAILDVAPTLLALAGLPPARDMPGRVLAEALRFPPSGPPVATYESGGAPQAATRDREAEAEILERLRSLGYLGPKTGPSGGPVAAPQPRSPHGERNLAALAFEAGRYEEAVAAYERLVAEDSKDGALRTSLAGALGALGRYAAAARQLDEAVRLDPLDVEAYHNRGALLERQGKRAEAVVQYRTAVRYNPAYEPSRQALLRLTGSADVRVPRNEAEARAAALAEEAGSAARRGDYREALRLLDAAERAAPRYVVVHQYRSNVAYLIGDFDAARTALRKALALEPDNALFRSNLARLEARAAQGK